MTTPTTGPDELRKRLAKRCVAEAVQHESWIIAHGSEAGASDYHATAADELRRAATLLASEGVGEREGTITNVSRAEGRGHPNIVLTVVVRDDPAWQTGKVRIVPPSHPASEPEPRAGEAACHVCESPDVSVMHGCGNCGEQWFTPGNVDGWMRVMRAASESPDPDIRPGGKHHGDPWCDPGAR